jgi:hypothetical protein
MAMTTAAMTTTERGARLRRTLAAIAAVGPSRTGHTGPDIPEVAERYRRRNRLVVAALAQAAAHGLPAGVGVDPDDVEHPIVVFIELPSGQVCWHLPAHQQRWDGHSTTQKYARIGQYTH